MITYQLESGRPTVVTHRVTGIGVDARGELRYTTQGDANSAPDVQTVRPVQVRARAGTPCPTWVGSTSS